MIGPSGCGKSTYLRSLNRMNDLIPGVTITGSVVYKGKDIYSPKQDIVDLRKEIDGFQQPNPFPFNLRKCDLWVKIKRSHGQGDS